MLGHCRQASSRWSRPRSASIFNADDDEQARERVTAGHRAARRRPRRRSPSCSTTPRTTCSPSTRFPREHWTKLRSTNPLERVNREIGRRTDVVGIFPNDAALIRLAGALLIEQNDEWLVGRRYLSQESLSVDPGPSRSTLPRR